MVPTLLGITLLTFVLMQLAPGDPATMRFDADGEAGAGTSEVVSTQALERFRATYLLDQPLWKQYLHYVGPFDLSADGHPWFGGSGARPWGGLVLGDLRNEMMRPRVRVADELARRLRVTVPLALVSVLLAYGIALPLGIWSVLRRGSRLDVAATMLVFLLYAVPTFWAGLMLQFLFGATGLDWLPVLGLRDAEASTLGPWASAWDLVRHAVLPVVCMTYGGFAYLSRQMRSGLLETIEADYVRTARAKGLSERAVVLRHALRNALLPVVTLFASVLPFLIGGSVLVESIFDLPGMGRYAYEGLLQRDYFVVLATTTLSAVLTLLGILVADLAYAVLDPRIRLEGRR